jgi:hypothetical protein
MLGLHVIVVVLSGTRVAASLCPHTVPGEADSLPVPAESAWRLICVCCVGQQDAGGVRARRSNGARPSVLDNGASVDYGTKALQSVEGLMGKYSDLTGVPMHQLRAGSSGGRFPAGHDPAEGALRSLDAVAHLIASCSATARW